MDRPPIVGYIVTGSHGPLSQGFDPSVLDPGKGVLYTGDFATLWPSYEAARAAVRRSRRYSLLHKLRWETWVDWKIVAVRAPGRRPT